MNTLALIVEDDADAVVIFSEALQQAGLAVEVAFNGNQALRRLAERVPDLIVLDWHLPHASGRDVLDFVQADARFEDTLVILASADILAGEKITGRVEVLIKPVGFKQLRDLVKRYAENSHRGTEDAEL
ncbi:MAG: response regulator [Thermoflexales bacterium]|nr:response regulator [Thermoflexales bacterium]